MSNSKALFLHGGPGLHAAVERAWFGDLLPVLWWDQPAIAAGDPAPFRTLVDHAARQLRTIADANNGQVDLVAHSFGGQIAAALAKEQPAYISRITLLGCGNPILQFFNLGKWQLGGEYEHPELQNAIAAAQEKCDESRFFSLAQACFPERRRPDFYFGPDSSAAQERYFALASSAPPLDISTFFSVMRDMLLAPPLPQINDFAGNVTVFLGKHDPLLQLDEDMERWRRIFPQSQFRIVNAGHIPHLELPPEMWFYHA
ncbi:MAG: alpha/beta hydrolase [Gallionellaceae bacterium]|nr:alpha/beta hydrolase [Gallionellaceae bacterium]